MIVEKVAIDFQWPWASHPSPPKHFRHAIMSWTTSRLPNPSIIYCDLHFTISFSSVYTWVLQRTVSTFERKWIGHVSNLWSPPPPSPASYSNIPLNLKTLLRDSIIYLPDSNTTQTLRATVLVVRVSVLSKSIHPSFASKCPPNCCWKNPLYFSCIAIRPNMCGIIPRAK